MAQKKEKFVCFKLLLSVELNKTLKPFEISSRKICFTKLIGVRQNMISDKGGRGG